MGNPLRRVAGLATAAVLVAAGVVAPTAQAAVSTSTTISNIKVTNSTPGQSPDTPLDLSQTANVGFDFASPSKVGAGDTFGLSFPTEFQIASTVFPVYQQGQPADAAHTLANCVAAPRDAAAAIVTCAYTDYAASLDSVTNGHVNVSAYATKTTNATSVGFTPLTGTVITVDLPGTGSPGIGPATTPVPAGPVKSGTEVPKGTLHWVINIPGNWAQNKGDIVVTDDVPAGLEAPTNVQLYRFKAQTGWDYTEPYLYPAGTFQTNTPVAPDDLKVTIPRSVFAGDQVYRLQYDTKIVGDRVTGTTYSNKAKVQGVDVTSTITLLTLGDGSADGSTAPTTSATPTSETTSATPTSETTSAIPTTTPCSCVPVTVTETKPAPPAVTVTETKPAPPAVTVTETKPAPPAETVTQPASTVTQAPTTTPTVTLITTVTSTRSTGTNPTSGVQGSLDGGSLGGGSSNGSSNGSGEGSMASTLPLAFGALLLIGGLWGSSQLGSLIRGNMLVIPGLPPIALPFPVGVAATTAQAPGPTAPNGRG